MRRSGSDVTSPQLMMVGVGGGERVAHVAIERFALLSAGSGSGFVIVGSEDGGWGLQVNGE